MRITKSIDTPNGVAIQITLIGDTLSLSDLNGQEFSFSAQLIPEFLALLQDFEKIYWGTAL